MPEQHIIAVEFNVVNAAAPTITINDGNPLDIVVGQSVSFPMAFTRGHPPITEAQLRNLRVHLYTDSDRTDRLGMDDEEAYRYEVRDIDMSAGTATFRVTVSSDRSPRALYPNVIIEQGE